MTEQNQQEPEISFTHETLALNLGAGRYWTLTADDASVTGVHLGPSGVTMCSYRIDDPFDSIRSTTYTWRSIDKAAIDCSTPDHVHVGIEGTDTKVTFAFMRENIDYARALYQALLTGIACVT